MELRSFGVAATHGDGFAWLAKERIFFTGDACVNGPYNCSGASPVTAKPHPRTSEKSRGSDDRLEHPGLHLTQFLDLEEDAIQVR